MKTLDYLKLYDNNNSNSIIDYLEYIKLYKSKSTIQTYANSIKNFYNFLYNYYSIGQYNIVQSEKILNSNNIRLSKDILLYDTMVLYNKVNRKCIEDYISYQVNKNLGADIIHCRVMAVKSYFKYLVKLKKISTETFFDIFDELKTPKIIVKNQLLIKADETLSITKKIKEKSESFADERNIFMLLLMSNTGIRRKELACIDIDNIHFDNNTIAIYKSKGDKPRIISFSNSIKSKLFEYLKLRKSILKQRNKIHNMLFIKTNGDPLNINTISTIMHFISKKTNIKVTCHSLRRGFATDMAENGTDIYVISKMLGHQNINTTVSRYIYVLAGMIKEAMENHPFSKNTKYKNSTNKDCIKKDIKTNMLEEWKDLTVRMNEILNSFEKIEKDFNRA
ncbi:tyrosine-type recombinase/integrase [Brachyspira hyodysenteriae]|uniref:tyrosine-type recombinase/integrase n=1 Tax=Brachyspira hyodysenteriae TaxID=159 RepID=UPI0022CD7B77|nr:tyrosine-type recombinase/integrase [Brachyspira hyodysenteriae]MCZ9852186.1 tyrosine-type recombinase/integrase [Brachyspira hyodysenteriae]MCZ9861809.1 tyrosine-type recombinase/integrase [Brachyspira hyodysenteriae]MCZ9877345.1 tyrosine-type recombinase/integrase [Brachyspira hyodysenteriae]MCZ9893664.1 tyrosine-type recombinase/integrase [Brachyspira hyodysenteriae]MCZ9893936.1 tyrosine-type recombinase/integrase [Brachyspira hyodysenteriae]